MSKERASPNDEPYGVVEKVAAGTAAAGAILASLLAAPGWIGVGGAALALLCVAIAVIDRRRFLIPDELSAALLLAGLAVSALAAENAAHGFFLAAARAAVMFAAFLTFRIGFRRLRGFDGIGLGDVKLAAAAGAWLDWASLPLAVNIAALAALAAALVQRLRSKEVGMRSRLPFGAFLAPAIWLCWIMATVGENESGLGLAALGAR
ncbi:MAG TPA: A24 family peptidase [Roseiarcus sp.]|nr:A24 family peptidase [Roseiarcus sp.]